MQLLISTQNHFTFLTAFYIQKKPSNKHKKCQFMAFHIKAHRSNTFHFPHLSHHGAHSSMRTIYLFGEDVLQGEAERGSQSADESWKIKGQLGGRGQQHPPDDGDERHIHLRQKHTESEETQRNNIQFISKHQSLHATKTSKNDHFDNWLHVKVIFRLCFSLFYIPVNCIFGFWTGKLNIESDQL